MTFAAVDFWLAWGGGAGVDIFTKSPGPGLLEDWGPSIVPGSPGAPTGVGLLSFGTGPLPFTSSPPVPAPSSLPSFLGYLLESIEGTQLGIVLCSGPAPVANPGHGGQYEVDPQGLTALQAWFIGPSGTDTVASWLPLTAGDYYYIAFEVYTGGTTSGRLAVNVELDVLAAAVATEYLSAGEQIFPIGGLLELVGVLERGAGAVNLLIDWGDATTMSHTYSHSGLGTQADDWFANNDLASIGPPLSHTYAARGLYTITATFTDAAGGTSVSTVQIAVVGPPTCTLTLQPQRILLPGTVAVTAGGQSDAWDLMGSGSAGTNPDGYDPTVQGTQCFLRPPHTGWELSVDVGDGFGSDHVTVADWEGSGVPVHDPSPSSPAPGIIWLPADTTNQTLRDEGDPATLRLVINECFLSWSQDAICSVDLPLTAAAQRQFPRDDGLGASAQRTFPPPTSVQLSQRRGPTAIR